MTAPSSWHTGEHQALHKRLHFSADRDRSFINHVISFCMLGFALYGLAHFYTMVSHDPIIKHTKKCKYCRQRINEKVCKQKYASRRRLTWNRLRVAFTAQAGLMAGKTRFGHRVWPSFNTQNLKMAILLLRIKLGLAGIKKYSG